MSDTPRIIKRVTRTGADAPAGFKFTEAQVRKNGPSDYINTYRQEAYQQYLAKALPVKTEEAWRRTDLQVLESHAAQLTWMDTALATAAIPAGLLEPLAGERGQNQITLAGTTVERVIDPELDAQGLILLDLKTAEQFYPEVVEKVLGKLVSTSVDKPAAMAAAFNQNGVLLYIPRNMRIDTPIHSLFWGLGGNEALFTHLLVYADEGSEATLVHEFASADGINSLALHAGIVEIIVAQNANFRFVELQSWGENVWNITHEKLKIEKGATAEWIFGSAGSRLTKNFSDIEMAGEGASGKVSGFYFTSGKQHLDHDTQQLHMAPNTTSDLLFKGALIEESRSVWQGMIYVAPEAQRTDGYQTNRNLILSRDARADSIPGLEILADDVKCSHGATVGRIDETQIFYLLSRGIPYPEAERLIVEGYFDPIMERIPFEGVKTRFHQVIEQKMSRII